MRPRSWGVAGLGARSKNKIIFPALFIILALLTFIRPAFAEGEDQPELSINTPPVLIAQVPFNVFISVSSLPLSIENHEFQLEILHEGGLVKKVRGRFTGVGMHRSGGREYPVLKILLAGETREDTEIRGLTVEKDGNYDFRLVLTDGDKQIAFSSASTIFGPISLLPPIIAIGVALITRQVIASLLAGVFIGALFVNGLNPIEALMRTFDHYVFGSLFHSDHLYILIFSVMLGGLVGIISRNGGTRGVVDAIVSVARRRRTGMVSTWMLGVAIFFDDYSNTLIVGNTMRPFTDRFRISREKLSYLVDSTAAPVAAIALVGSWIGFEVGLIGDAFDKIHVISADPYTTFIQTIPYCFYPILALVFGFFVSYWSRDFGPMAEAERRALFEGTPLRPGSSPLADYDSSSVESKPGVPTRWYNSVVPILTVIALVIGGMIYTGLVNMPDGTEVNFGTILENADSFQSLLWASFGGVLVAIVLSLGQRILTLQESFDSVLGGMRSMMLAVVILTLAWSIGMVADEVNTSLYVVHLLGSTFPSFLLPALIFLVAAGISFATGTSWGTMGILMPLVVGLAHNLAPGDWNIMLGSVASVLAGSVFGDHCSPISDTTVMSSMASAVDHIDHVRTQLPYAVLVAAVAVVFCYIPAALGVNPLICLIGSSAILALILWLISKPLSSADVEEDFLNLDK